MDPKSIKKPLKNHLKIKVRKKKVQNRQKMEDVAKKSQKSICGSPTSIVFDDLGAPDCTK